MIDFYDIKEAHLAEENVPAGNWEVIHFNDAKRMDAFFYALFRAVNSLQTAKQAFRVQWIPKYLVVDASKLSSMFLRTKGYYTFEYLCKLLNLPEVGQFLQVAVIYRDEVPFPLKPFYDANA